nr:LOW QUALITY PROTEIN: vomeronasal type-1 receptor 4-like [Vicugna pacos]
MDSRKLTLNVIILMQTVVEILGNFSLLCLYIHLYITGYRLRSTDLIIKHLIVANFLVLLCKGVPHTMTAFVWKHFSSDAGCKLFLFLHRVGRGVSIGSICLLSVFRVIMVSPRNSRWAELKVKAPKYIVPSILLCWILQMLLNIIFLIYVHGIRSDRNITNNKDFGYCSSIRHDKTRDALFAALLLFPDVSCLGLMLLASGSMIFILHRHKQEVQHIHRTSASHRFSPESKATKTILLLVTTFVYFYTLSSIFQIVLSLLDNPSWFLVAIATVMSACFPAVSPFVLISRDSSVHSLYFAWIRNVNPLF